MENICYKYPSHHGTRGPKEFFRDQDGTIFDSDIANSTTSGTKQEKFHCQSMPTGSAFAEAVAASGLFPSRLLHLPPKNPRIERPRDKSFDSFKTCSGKLEGQLSNLRRKSREIGQEANTVQNVEVETLPAHRYFDALEGPELDTLRASEEILLPEDQRWPFLLRFPVSSFSICLGVGSQAILWKTLATSPSTKFLHVSLDVNLLLRCIAVALVAAVYFTYMLKVIFYFEAVRHGYYHPVRINYFFAPWIALLFLVLGVPPSIAQNIHSALWYILMTPIFCLELKIYGQWMSGGQRRLSKVANPSNHLSVVGNFVGALLAASRLPTNETLPKELHPVSFLFVAAPSAASIAWARIQGSFDYGSWIAYFIALFLYLSLAVRVNFFRGFRHGYFFPALCISVVPSSLCLSFESSFIGLYRFSLAWWAYTFPMTGAAIATINYSAEVPNVATKSLSVLLSAISTLVVTLLLVTTILRAFVLRDLFPNDIAIAITDQRPKARHHKWFHRTTGSPDKDIENCLNCMKLGTGRISRLLYDASKVHYKRNRQFWHNSSTLQSLGIFPRQMRKIHIFGDKGGVGFCRSSELDVLRKIEVYVVRVPYGHLLSCKS
ncbi:hypothetical protein RHMOL_Rhmol03G0221800 [Rhododendron molle]|uniref:Uncharacterized protein n=1 Tax=Rhododendron molle TaxID=49168 RepID=A0ACC0PGV7_RHOML|nr:hypothetical protein RHMOL_Rhmol03G0221800 [Rhododendron molle]